jgi:pimeloyl-ACP methyl ester carboxylesterase
MLPVATMTNRLNVTDDDLRRALAAFHRDARSNVLEATRYHMRYFVWGAGPPIVFVHGMAEHGRGFVLPMHQLVDRFTCIAYELPNGLTDGSDLKPYTLKLLVADLQELLDHLGLATTIVLGSSFGTTITLAAMAAFPKRITKSILQGGFAHRPLSRAEQSLARTARYWPGWFADWPAIHEAVMKWVAQPTWAVMPPEVRQFFLENGGRTPIGAAALRSLIIGRTDLRPLLPTLPQPLLLIGGDRDPLVPLSCEREIEQAVPRARRMEIPGCGHFPQYTHPMMMAEVVKEFLRVA